MMMIRFPAPRIFSAVATLLLVWAASRPAPVRAATPEQIDAAIEKGKRFVYSLQKPDGRWETDRARVGTEHTWEKMQGDTFGGYSALATYALLASGETANTPRLKPAIAFLKTADIVGIYAIGMRLQVWLLIPHESSEIKALIHKDAGALFNGLNAGPESLKPDSSVAGLWDYLGKGTRVDHSVSQYGVLGLWAAQQSGVVDVGAPRWKSIEGAWRRDQHESGAWTYGSGGGNETIPMTAAGVASLFITAEYLHSEEGIACTGILPNRWIDHGLEWIDTNYAEINNNLYAMYGIERIGTASGYRFFGSRDWFADLSDRLVKSQEEEGSWSSGYPGATKLDATCFALLFLSRGRAPVFMSKLDYRTHVAPPPSKEGHPVGPGEVLPANWNERPRDLANVAAWLGHQTEIFRNWQIINFQTSPDDWHDAPVIYLSGNDPLNITPTDAKKIKLFVQQGGMVLGNADCGREAFSSSFVALGRSLFGGTFRELPASHPMFTHEQFPAKRWRARPRVLGLTNGVRELMVLVPNSDPARWWQTPNGAAGHEDAFELGADLCQYASDRQTWNKGVTYLVKPTGARAPRRVKVARLSAGPNWDPEPGGWTRLAAVMHNGSAVDLDVFPAVPGGGALAAAQVAHLTGTTPFTLSNAARLELKSFVDQGGTLVVDAAGGSLPFADAAEQELKAIFGGDAVRGLERPLPPDHPLYTLPENKIEEFGYRSWARANSVGALKEPRVRGITVGNRVAVFFSREDISAGLVGEPVDGILGYSPQTATDLMRNIILYSSPVRTPKAK